MRSDSDKIFRAALNDRNDEADRTANGILLFQMKGSQKSM